MTLGAGERLAIVGPSGVGKTTLLNLIAGILRPNSGRIDVAGTEVTALSDAEQRLFRASHVGFVFQDFALLDYLPARQNILYPYRISGGLRLDAEARARAEALALACGIGDKLDRHPGALSQGEQQRVAICRALVTQPKLVLSDEATGNLDPESKARILDLLFERAEEAGAGVVAVTHDHELLPRFDRVLDFAEFREGAVS
jgi:putative ABC transport system ATP-binding protein